MSQPSSEPAVTVGVLKETTPGEQRVAVVPESVPALARAGVRVLVEPGAGASAWFPDGAYERAGAKSPWTRSRPRPTWPATRRRWSRPIISAGSSPMLITAAGTSRPANVLVLGAGVAGLQAMGTARRLGAVVTGYDIRPETREQIESVGARLLRLATIAPAEGEGGYARALTAEEQAAQQAALAAQIARFDIVITTAQVPGRRPPLLVTAEAVKGMQAGSVLVDLAASSLGGNVEGSEADQTVLTGDGVRIIGAGNLPAQVPTAASTAYSHNIVALLAELVHDGALTIDPADEIQAGVVATHQGTVVHPAVAALLGSPAEGGSS